MSNVQFFMTWPASRNCHSRTNHFGLIANGWNPSSQRLLSAIITYFPNEIALWFLFSAFRHSKLLTFKWDFRFIPPQFFLITDLGFYCHEMLRQFLKISDISLRKMSASSPSRLKSIRICCHIICIMFITYCEKNANLSRWIMQHRYEEHSR